MAKAKRTTSRHLRAKQPLQRGAYQALTNAIQRRAAELDLSVRVLAGKMGKSRTMIHRTLKGQRRIDPIEFIEWCEVLKWDDPVAIIRSVRRL